MKKFTVRYLDDADADLADILFGIEDFTGSADLAWKYVQRIKTFCEKLDLFPDRGTNRDDLQEGLQMTHFEKKYLVAYTIDNTEKLVSILRIQSTKMNSIVVSDKELPLN